MKIKVETFQMTYFITSNRRQKSFPHFSIHTHFMFDSHVQRTSDQNHILCIVNMLLPKSFFKHFIHLCKMPIFHRPIIDDISGLTSVIARLRVLAVKF